MSRTERAEATLLAEGVPRDEVVLTGNTVVDALQWLRDARSSMLAAPAGLDATGRLTCSTQVSESAAGWSALISIGWLMMRSSTLGAAICTLGPRVPVRAKVPVGH